MKKLQDMTDHEVAKHYLATIIDDHEGELQDDLYEEVCNTEDEKEDEDRVERIIGEMKRLITAVANPDKFQEDEAICPVCSREF